MANQRCSAIRRAGGRCQGVAIGTDGLCWAHSPSTAEERKRAARRGGKLGGRGRPAVELREIKRQLAQLAEDVLEGKVKRADAGVLTQIHNVRLRALAVSLRVKESEELEQRIIDLERRAPARGSKWVG